MRMPSFSTYFIYNLNSKLKLVFKEKIHTHIYIFTFSNKFLSRLEVFREQPPKSHATIKLAKEELNLVQWLRVRAPNAGGPGLIPGQKNRSCLLQLKILHAKIEDHSKD